jgi:pimeloyl-ACP methyl ester carboxylesterase
MTQPLAWVPPDRSDQVLGRYMELWNGYNGRDALNPKPESGPVPPVDVTRLRTIGVPVLVIVGDHEDNANWLLKLMPQAKRVVLTNAGHGGHLTQPEAYNKILKTFLDDVRRHTKP